MRHAIILNLSDLLLPRVILESTRLCLWVGKTLAETARRNNKTYNKNMLSKATPRKAYTGNNFVIAACIWQWLVSPLSLGARCVILLVRKKQWDDSSVGVTRTIYIYRDSPPWFKALLVIIGKWIVLAFDTHITINLCVLTKSFCLTGVWSLCNYDSCTSVTFTAKKSR